MKLKQKLMAAAVALVAASGANAAMDNIASGNGTLAFIALDRVGTPISAMMDLNYNLDSFLPSTMSAAGTHIVWNFNTNSLTVNGVAQSVSPTWSSAMSVFAGAAQAAETKWAVIAGDSLTTGVPGDVRYLTTSNTALATLQNQTRANLTQMSGVNLLFNANNLLQPNSIDGSTATSGQGYVGATTYVNNGEFKWNNRFIGDSFAAEGMDSKFYMLDTTSGTSTHRALVTQFAAANPEGPATFSYAAGVLTYDVAAVVPAIPEPSEYALMLAGLGMLGFMSRRRLANRA